MMVKKEFMCVYHEGDEGLGYQMLFTGSKILFMDCVIAILNLEFTYNRGGGQYKSTGRVWGGVGPEGTQKHKSKKYTFVQQEVGGSRRDPKHKSIKVLLYTNFLKIQEKSSFFVENVDFFIDFFIFFS